jgi:Tfp pilus assembly protein PilN
LNRVNFLPEDYLEKKHRRRAAVICATLLGVVIGGATIIGVAFRISIKGLQDQQLAVQRKCAADYRTIQNLDNVHEQEQAVARQAEQTASLLEGQLPRSSILSEIGQALPPEVVLTDLTMEPAADPANPDETIKLTGQANEEPLVVDLIAQLKRSRLFTNVRRSAPDFVMTGGKVHEFQLQMTLNSQAGAAMDLPQAKSETVSLNPE